MILKYYVVKHCSNSGIRWVQSSMRVYVGGDRGRLDIFRPSISPDFRLLHCTGSILGYSPPQPPTSKGTPWMILAYAADNLSNHIELESNPRRTRSQPSTKQYIEHLHKHHQHHQHQHNRFINPIITPRRVAVPIWRHDHSRCTCHESCFPQSPLL